MNLIKQPSESELELLQIETFKNINPEVTKVSDHGVLRGLIRGNVRVAKKALKDIALSLSNLFPDLASGETLDSIAADRGISPRRGSAASSTYVRLVGRPGTRYSKDSIISDQLGNEFKFSEQYFTVNDYLEINRKGYCYAKVNCSNGKGAATNVDAFTLTEIKPVPLDVPDDPLTPNVNESRGHVGVINEYAAQGGRDAEDDDTFRSRIKSSNSFMSRQTLEFLGLLFANADDRVLKVYSSGVESGKSVLSVVTVNGVTLTDVELDNILDYAAPYMSLSEISSFGLNRYGVKLQNAPDEFIDIDMRLELDNTVDVFTVVKNIQQKYSKMVDWRFWNYADKISWIDLISAARSVKGVKYIPSIYFSPKTDIMVQRGRLPRFRGFIVRDLEGIALITQPSSGNDALVDPVFYPSLDEYLDEGIYATQ